MRRVKSRALWNKGSSALARDKHGQSPILLAARGAPQIVLMFMEGAEERQALMSPAFREEVLSRVAPGEGKQALLGRFEEMDLESGIKERGLIGGAERKRRV